MAEKKKTNKLTDLTIVELESLFNLAMNRESYYRNMVEINDANTGSFKEYQKYKNILTNVCEEVDKRLGEACNVQKD